MPEKVDAMTVRNPRRRSPESITMLDRSRQIDLNGNGEAGRVVVEEGLWVSWERLVQTRIPNYDRTPVFFTDLTLSPIDQERPAMHKNALAVSHLLEHPIPPAAHATVGSQHFPDIVSLNPVPHPGLVDILNDGIADSLLVVLSGAPLRCPFHQGTVTPIGQFLRNVSEHRSPSGTYMVGSLADGLGVAVGGKPDVPVEFNSVYPDLIGQRREAEEYRFGKAGLGIEVKFHRGLSNLRLYTFCTHLKSVAHRPHIPKNDPDRRRGATNEGRKSVTTYDIPLGRLTFRKVGVRVKKSDRVTTGKIKVYAVDFWKRGTALGV